MSNSVVANDPLVLFAEDLDLDVDQKIVVQIKKWDGKKRMDIRFYYLDTKTRKWHATKRGIVVSPKDSYRLAEIFKKAEEFWADNKYEFSGP